MTVWLAQCLCGPERHAILANAGEATTAAAAAELVTGLRKAVGELLGCGMNPWCGLCHAPASGWHYEVKPTAYATLIEALPALKEIEARQIAIGLVLGELSGTGKH